jgi:succinate dehydrogenase / fumarate reductase membrane anchor subunit
MATTTIAKERGRSMAGLYFIVQAVTGILLIFTLGAHMIAHHFVVEGGLRDYEQVVSYLSNPLVFALEVIFLFLATIHGLLGVRAVLFDMGLSERGQQTTEWILRIIALLTLIYGLWLAISLQGL